MDFKSFKNITLIGMAGSGKSTIGKELAKKINFKFLDVDKYIEQKEGKRLQQIIDEIGEDGFKTIEEKRILGLDLLKHVISPGGSVILSKKAMEHLKKFSLIIFLNIPFEVIKKRLNDIDTRGIVGLKNETLREIFDFRLPLYHQYADVIIHTSSDNEPIKKIVQMILKKL